MFFCLLFFCVVILCVNRSLSSFILYRKVRVKADSPMFEEYGHAQTMVVTGFELFTLLVDG